MRKGWQINRIKFIEKNCIFHERKIFAGSFLERNHRIDTQINCQLNCYQQSFDRYHLNDGSIDNRHQYHCRHQHNTITIGTSQAKALSFITFNSTTSMIVRSSHYNKLKCYVEIMVIESRTKCAHRIHSHSHLYVHRTHKAANEQYKQLP